MLPPCVQLEGRESRGRLVVLHYHERRSPTVDLGRLYDGAMSQAEEQMHRESRRVLGDKMLKVRPASVRLRATGATEGAVRNGARPA